MQFTINTQDTTTNSQTHMHKISAPCEKQKIEDAGTGIHYHMLAILLTFQLKSF